MKKKHIIRLVLIVIAIMIFAMSYKLVMISEGESTVKLVSGIVKLSFSKKDYIEISKEKYIAKSDSMDEFIQYMEESGWTFKEQLGSGYVFYNEEKTKTISTRKFTKKYLIISTE